MVSATHGQRATILLVEDDPVFAAMIKDALDSRGYCVWRATCAAEADSMADEVQPDLIIVDLMLPDIHGLVLCANLREKRGTPIIICSGTKRKDDPTLGFKLGADDFVAKPFSVDELEARIEAALRHAAPRSSAEPRPTDGSRCIGELVIDPARCRVTLGGEVLCLTPTEYRLLCALADRPDEVFSRQELASRVWGYHDAGVGRSLEVHLRRLRAKLNARPVPAPPLLTVRGFGYLLVGDASSQVATEAGRRA
jgi:DNA-binding response OmpR family regulator